MTPYLLDGYPDTFTSVAGRCHGVDELLQPDTGVHHHALELVLPHKDAALRVVRIIACMDADALEIRHTHQQWQPTLESWRIRYDHRISTLRNGSMARYLTSLHAALAAIAGINFLRL